MASEAKHVAFDEERLVEIIEDDPEKYETRDTRATGRKAFLIFTSFCLGVLLAGYGVRHCGHAVRRHMEHKYVHIVASAQSLELPRIKANIYVPPFLEPAQKFDAIVVNKRADNANASVCTTEACLDFAKSIKSNFAPNYTAIDPCEDFEQYVCSGWKQNHDYRSDQASISIGSLMADSNRAILRLILEGTYAENVTMSAVNKTIDRHNFDKMKTGYTACMNEDRIKEAKTDPVRKILDELEMHYPRVAPANEPADELTKAMIWLAHNKVDSFVSSGVTVRSRKKPDDKNPDINIIGLGGGESGLPSKEYYNNTKVLGNYKKSLAQMMKVIWTGEIMTYEQIAQEAPAEYAPIVEKIVELEAKIARASPDPDVASEVGYYYNIVPIEEMDKKVPEISISTILKDFVPKNYTIKTVLMSDPWYYGNLSSIIKATPRETLHAYFQSRLISTWAGRLHKDYTRPARAMSNSLAGRAPDAISERWRTCVGEVDGKLGWLLSGAFIERAFSAQAKELGDRIVKDIKFEFNARLKNIDWMSPATKEVAAKKVVNIVQKIGYPTASPNVADPGDLRKYYEKLSITDNYFDNARAAATWATEKSWFDLAIPVDRNRWSMSAPTVNAYYSPSGNEIVFPAGIMQLPVFSDALPEYVSYGAFGAVAGHELTHGFDNNGAHYDENGRYSDWWDNVTVSNFDKKTKCFVDQYSRYTITGLDGQPLHVNGKLTQGENIADAGGLSASYSAWERRDKVKPNQLLQGLEEFSKEQMFFVSYANWWCGKTREAALVNQVLTDPHSPSDKRILGTLANSRPFKEAFKCKVKEPTCELW